MICKGLSVDQLGIVKNIYKMIIKRYVKVVIVTN